MMIAPLIGAAGGALLGAQRPGLVPPVIFRAVPATAAVARKEAAITGAVLGVSAGLALALLFGRRKNG